MRERMVTQRFTVALERYENGAGGFNELSVSRNKSCNFQGMSYTATYREECGSDKEV